MSEEKTTKFHQEVISTSNIDEIKGRYLAERLLRSWEEDFADEDRGEVVSIERKELLFDKGTFVSSDILSQINFYLQSNDISEVKISNQQRSGFVSKGFTSVWSVTIQISNKKYTYLLYANSMDLAIKIITDYLEQDIEGGFILHTVKELSYSNLIAAEEDAEELEFYKIELEVKFEFDEPYESTYILLSKDAESAKKSIAEYISKKSLEENRTDPFEVTIISAKTISCHGIVDYKFSEEYFNKES